MIYIYKYLSLFPGANENIFSLKYAYYQISLGIVFIFFLACVTPFMIPNCVYELNFSDVDLFFIIERIKWNHLNLLEKCDLVKNAMSSVCVL